MTKRAISAVAALSGVALVLAGCGGNSSPAATSSSPGSATGTADTLNTAAPERDANADLVIWADADRAKILQSYADKFGADKGVKVKVQIAADEKVREQFKDATKVGKGPDVVVGAHDWLGEFVQNGLVAPIPLSADDAGKFAPQAIAATKFGGQQYGVPYAVENLGLVRNTALAPDAPKTMDEIVAKGTELKSAGKADNILIQQVSQKGNAYYAYPYVSAFEGGGIFGTKDNGDYDPAKVIVGSPASIKGGQVLADLGAKKILSTAVDGTNMDTLFDGGKAPYMITGPWSIDKAKKANIKYAISPLPSLAGGGAMKPFLGVQMFYVSAKAKNSSVAQEFVTKAVTQKDFQVSMFEAGHRPPALTEAYNEVSGKDPDVKAWFEAGKEGKPMPNIPAMNAVWGPFGQATADIISGAAKPEVRLPAAQAEIIANIAKG